jgi:16S rRNA A1518/A1519 N6-dimethyltransferase RsmA/KsgA/DIM1 with predicted DNA glycosylase/AP lyase activity
VLTEEYVELRVGTQYDSKDSQLTNVDLRLFNPDPKYKSQVLAKTCRDVAQLGENKGRWKELTEQANSLDFSFFLNFSLIFLKGTSRNQTF